MIDVRFLKYLLALLLIVTFSWEGFTQSTGKKCIVTSAEYPGNDPVMWYALYSSVKTGEVYTGLCTEGGSAHFYLFDPSKKDKKNIMVSEIASFENEKGKGIRASAKIHNKPVEDLEGNIYFVPMNNGSGPRVIDYNSYRGSHWVRYDPKTGTLKNLGELEDGFYPLTIDNSHGLLYGVSFTGYLFQFDLKTRKTRNFGRVSNWDIGRTIFCDDKGNVYGTLPKGRVWKFDYEKQEVVDLPPIIPFDASFYPTTLLNPMIDRTYDWRAVEWDSVGKVAYGITCGSGSTLFRYDPHKGKNGEVISMGSLTSSKFWGTGRKDLPFSTLAFTLDQKNRKIYFVPSARDYAIDGSAETFNFPAPSHLIEYDLATNSRIDLGAIVTDDGRRVFGCEAATVGQDGTLYFCGQVEVRNKEKATHFIGDIPVALQLLIYKQ